MFYLGLDLGQRRDHSAIVVVERMERRRAYVGSELDGMLVRHLERVSLGTPYPKVVARGREMVNSRELVGECRVIVDGTGVGAPIVEMMRAAQLGCELRAVTITGGGRASRSTGLGGTNYSVPKQDLLAGLQGVAGKRAVADCQGFERDGCAGAGIDGCEVDQGGGERAGTVGRRWIRRT